MPAASVTYNVYTVNSITGLLTIVSENNLSTGFSGIPCGVGAVISANYTITYGYSAEKVDTDSANWSIQGVHVDFILQNVNSLFPSWNQPSTAVPFAVPQSFSINFVQVSG